ncbi:MAG: glucokinase [Pseudomonadota bacterium]
MGFPHGLFFSGETFDLGFRAPPARQRLRQIARYQLHFAGKTEGRIDDKEARGRQRPAFVLGLAPDIELHPKKTRNTGMQQLAHRALDRAARLRRIPQKKYAGRKFAMGVDQSSNRCFEFVRRFIRRIDQHDAAPFGRRHQLREFPIAVAGNGARAQILVQHGAEQIIFLGMLFDGDKAILLAHQPCRDQGRSGIIFGRVFAHQSDIGFEDARRRSAFEQFRNAVFRLEGLCGLAGGHVVKPAPGMGVDHREGRFLLFEIDQHRHQRGMFQDVGEVPGVIGVTIIHFGAVQLAAMRVRLTMGPAMNQYEENPQILRLLVADIGGTHARFATATVRGGEVVLDALEILSSRDFTRLDDALHAYGRKHALPHDACLALAGPIQGDVAHLTNIGWHVDARRLGHKCGFARVILMNDFAALGFAVPSLKEGEVECVKEGTALPHAPISVMGAGTGFGATLLAPCGSGYALVSTESGHAAFAPTDAWEMRFLQRRIESDGHVSIESILSGKGLGFVHEALHDFAGTTRKARTPEDICRRALEDSGSTSAKALEIFCNIFGSVAGDIALTQGARGGVYLAGGVLLKNQASLMQSAFAERFAAKGIMSPYVADIPVFLIKAEHVALRGAALWFAQSLPNA